MGENFETKQEIIKVKDGKDILLRLRKSRHGPIITDAFSHFENNPLKEIKSPLAMWWVCYDQNNNSFKVFDNLARSKTVLEARNAVSNIASPGLNIMYANSKGDIAWWAAAKLPIRPEHVDSKMILDGASGKDDILGFYSFDKNPQTINPDSHLLLSANNQPEDTGIGLIPGYYVGMDRAKRIEQLLFNDKKDWTPEDMPGLSRIQSN